MSAVLRGKAAGQGDVWMLEAGPLSELRLRSAHLRDWTCTDVFLAGSCDGASQHRRCLPAPRQTVFEAPKHALPLITVLEKGI